MVKFMDEIWAVFKVMLDPLFIIFILLLVSLAVFLTNCKKKSDSLIIVLCLVFVYGMGIAPVSDYLCYYLEKDYINERVAGFKKNLDAIVVLGHGTNEIKSMKETFNTDFGTLRVVHAVTIYNKSGARYFVCAGKGTGDVSEAQTMAKLAEILGVPKDKIRIEPKSKNTSDHAGAVKKMLGDSKMNIGLVTSAFHMKRSERNLKNILIISNRCPLIIYIHRQPANVVMQLYASVTRALQNVYSDQEKSLLNYGSIKIIK
ncbi:MAG: YdcF family protein [Comamonadaceae bacterium]|nr:YdcF family protein [Comamonadaceae bacterium]